MNTSGLKTYAPKARHDFIAAVTRRAARFGLTDKGTSPVREEGQLVFIEGQPYPKAIGVQRQKLAARIEQQGFQQALEAAAYTWFNRFAAIRFMELHGYLEHSFRVLSHPAGNALPEILEHAQHVDLPGLDRERIIDLKMDATRDEELYHDLLLAQCHALHQAMPFLFEPVDDETELLLPDNLLQTDSLIREMVTAIPEEEWREIEIIGWLYQFYISEKKDQVIGKVVRSEDIPAATQLFTPNWIVKYMVQNSLGAQWLATYPHSPLKGQMEYYIEPAEQTDEVGAALAAITPDTLDPEELTLIDPASGSGHILVEAYELFKAIYLERGYRQREVARLILEKNLFGLDIDGRAAQLTGFALMMKGRADDRRLFGRGVKLNVMALVDSAGFDAEGLAEGVSLTDYGLKLGDLTELKRLFEHATTFGSLIQVPEGLADKLPALKQLSEVTSQDLFVSEALKRLRPLVQQAELLAAQYDAVVANPPYMGPKAMNKSIKEFGRTFYPNAKTDLFGMFIERGLQLARKGGRNAMVTMQGWMFLSSFEELRRHLLKSYTLESMAHLGARAFDQISGEVVAVTTFAFRNVQAPAFCPVFKRAIAGTSMAKSAVLRGVRERYSAFQQLDFLAIPGSPIAYWMSPATQATFKNPSLATLTISDGQNITGDNDKYVRLRWEVDPTIIGKGKKWITYAKGGQYRRWHGNLDFVVDWSDTARGAYRKHSSARIIPEYLWYRAGITWSRIASKSYSFRNLLEDSTFDKVGSSVFVSEAADQEFLLCLLNSAFAQHVFDFLNPSMDLQVKDVRNLPLPPGLDKTSVESLARDLRCISRADWAALQTSSDFQALPILTASTDPTPTLESGYTAWITQNRATIAEMKRLEEENNRLFIDAYGLADELTPDVPIEQITLTVNPAYRYKLSGEWLVASDQQKEEELERRFREDTMAELVSYAIGCMMGRYRLDQPGLIYAHSGNERFWDIYNQVASEVSGHGGEELQGIDRMAEGDADGGTGLSGHSRISAGGDLRINQSTSQSGGLRSVKYCGRTGAQLDSRVQELPVDLPGLTSRGGNSAPDRLQTELPHHRPTQPSHGNPRRSEQNATGVDEQTPLVTSHSPLATKFHPDDDGIIPLTDTEWFDDDAANRLIEFISVAWDAAQLEDNLTFLADNLRPKKSESSRDTPRRYLCDSFFKAHLRTYKKRPIYWLFSSGKQKAFQCLVYLHRYNEGTLSRMRMEYVVPLQSKMAARIDKLADDIQAATTSAQAKRLQKERDKLTRQLDELRRYDEQLRHYADLRIKLDLDDGVKVNYGKFGNLLAEVKAVTGKR